MKGRLVLVAILMLIIVSISNCFSQTQYGKRGKHGYVSPYKDSSDVKSYNFLIEGLKSAEETKKMDKQIAAKFGIISCHTNFNTKTCKVKVYDIVDLVNINELLAYNGYKINEADLQRYERKKALKINKSSNK